ncbi:phage tail protein [Longispora albida]|uniref:phage tail protein n=1 Tax=Longispora albida TaxID=203523 RepID=UPI000364532C|nr:phage tail protein [Longispora albida]
MSSAQPGSVRFEMPDTVVADPAAGLLADTVDELLAPLWDMVTGSLLDPLGAPVPLLPWLAAFSAVPDGSRLRHAIAGAIQLHRRRGTVAGLHGIVALYGGTAEITDSGTEPEPPSEPAGQPWVRITVTLPDPELREPLRYALESATPVHVRCEVVYP